MWKTCLLILCVASIAIQGNSKIFKKKSGRIINGDAARLGQFPWNAHLEVLRYSGSWFYCCGSLISSRWVLTAAHCLENAKQAVLHFGSINAYKGLVTVKSNVLIKHQYYMTRQPSYEYDIGLIKLPNEIKFNNYIKPALLPPRSMTMRSIEGRICHVSGFGSYVEGTGSTYLRFADVYIVPKDYCIFEDPLDAICAEGIRNNQITCSGDSGSGLIFVKNGKSYIVGVTSFGREYCVGTAGFESVHFNLDWISQVTGMRTYY